MNITYNHPDFDGPLDYELRILNLDSGLAHLIVDRREPDCDCGQPLRANDLVITYEDHSPLFIAHAACFVTDADTR